METNMSAPAPATANASAPATEAGAQPTQSQESKGQGQSQGQKPAAKAPAAPEKASAGKAELFDVKVDGKIVKMTRDELVQYASAGHAADRRFKEAAQMRKQAETVIGKLRDPEQVISALMDPSLGLSKDQIRVKFEEWYAKEFIEPESLSPQEKKLREAESKLKKYEEEEKKREEQKLKEQQESLTSQAREELQTQIIEALDSSGLPKTNFTIRRLAHWIQRNNANGFDAPTEVLVNQVRSEMNTSLRELVEASDGDVLIKLLGDNIIQKLRKYDLEQLRRSRQNPAPAQTETQEDATTTKSDRPPTSAEVNERIRQLQRTGRY